jgi:hypothetical protein
MSNEGFRIVVIVGVIISVFASRANKLIGGVVSCLVTTFILIFGLQAYSHSGYISIFGIQLTQGLFVIVILIWYGIDVKQIMDGVKVKNTVDLIRTGAAEKLRSGFPVPEVMAQILPKLENHPPDLRQLGGEILQGKPFTQIIAEYQAQSKKDEDQAVLRYQQAVDVLNSLRSVVVAEAAGLGPASQAESKSFFLPSVKLTSAKTLSFGKKLIKGELLYLYNGKWISSPEQLAAESGQTSAASQVPIRSLFRMPNSPAWISRKLDIKGGPLELDSDANG